MNLLHVDASILGAHSVSRQISAAVVARLRETTPDLQVIYRDLAAAPLSHLSGAHLAPVPSAASSGPPEDAAFGHAALEEFLRADIVVIGAPMYNFTIPSQLKAWIDRILVAGKTFRYGARGPEGLAGDKRVIVAISRGGFYGPGMPAAAAEHLETYLRTVLGFIGITKPEIIAAEGVQVGADERRRALDIALAAAAGLRAA